MKIVVLGLRGFPGVQGGVETHCEQLYPRIAARGHTVVVVCRKPYMTHPDGAYRGIRLLSIASPRNRSLEAFVHTFVGVLRARLLSPDILHIHAIGPSLMVPLARVLGMRVVSTNHGADYARQKWGKAARTVLRAGESMGSRFSHAVIAISRPIADHLRTTFARVAMLIPNGVVIRARDEGRDALDRFGIEDRRYVLCVGRFVPEKGFHDAVEAFRRAALDGWKLVIVGQADHASGYSEDLVRQAAADPNVVLTGFLSGTPLAQFYSHAGFFALPSYHEGLPIVLLEALSYGLPVVASDIPANRQAGLAEADFFPPGAVDRMAALLRIFANAPVDARAAEQRIAGVRTRFDWDVIADATLACYAEVLARGRRMAIGPSVDAKDERRAG